MVKFQMILYRSLRPVLLLMTSLLSFLTGGPALFAQQTTGERAIVSHYAAAESIPDDIADCIFDNQGNLWLVPENDNIRVFDGINVRTLTAPLAKGIPHFEFAAVMQDAKGNLHFLSRYRDLLFQVGNIRQLYFDSIATATNLPSYESYHYFNWVDPYLKKRVAQNRTFTPFDDSSFVFVEKDTPFLFRDRHLYNLRDARFDSRKALLLDRELVVLVSNRFIRIDTPSGAAQDILLAGDLLSDSLYHVAAAPPIKLLKSAHPHVLFNNKLYSVALRGKNSIETRFICDLGYLHHPITKVEYDPGQDITVVCTRGEGIYLVRPNPFFASGLSKQFQELSKKQIFYPLTLKDSTTFFTSWCEFSGSGYYKLLDKEHKGPRCLFTDHGGNIWEGTENQVLLYKKNASKPEEIAIEGKGVKVVDICENDGHEILCMTNNSLFLYKDGKFNDLKPVFTYPSDKLSFQECRYIGDGKYWMGSNKGLFTYDGRLNRVDRIDTIPNVYTINITKLSDGAILLSCYPMGYYFIYYKKQFHKISIDMDLGLKEIESILEDRRGRLWFATGNGLYVTSKEEIEAYCDGIRRSIYYYRYGKKDGLPEMEFNGGLNASNCISGDGYLSFNSMSGVLTFHQDTARQIFPARNIQLSFLGPSDKFIPAADSIELEHDNKGTIVQVSVPYYSSKENFLLEYKMGSGDAWQIVNSLGRIAIGHLAHGDYPLSVRVRTGLQPTDYFTRTTTFRVRPLFYETVLFKITAAILLLLVCTVVTVVILRLRREVRMKNISLYHKNEELQGALRELQENITLKEKLISLILHDLKTPLYFQSLLFSQIMEKDYFSSLEGREIFRELKNSSAGILRFTKEFLTWYSSQRDGFKVKLMEFDPMQIVNDLFLVYEDIAAKKNVTLQCRAAEISSVYTDRNILEIILRNLLDNAIKYTATGNVLISFERRTEGDAITVADTGKGMTPEKVQILENYPNLTHLQSPPTFGYRFIHTMAKKINAGIHISSRLGMGTSVTIIIPHRPNENAANPSDNTAK